ncbi:MaoC/PaaZ C-terminal domain-containing protein, partial [Vibrio parahaemolyticus]|uniref:MaoC/PaaZ C-terminal domain-containing protein n=1 Tax=Vibrio parahaemolyticus TaxID=670 RepID=UPI002112C55C
TVLALLALDNARFLLPVRPGDTISTDVEVLEKRTTSRADRGIVVFRDHVHNQRGEEVFRNDKTVLLKRRPA